MPRTAAQRIAQYNARMDNSLITYAYGAVAALAKANYAAHANYFVPLQDMLLGCLGAAGVYSADYFGYYAFNQEMLRISSRFSGVSRDLEVCILIHKYTALGLYQSVLEYIVATVWGSPTSPICQGSECGDEVTSQLPATGAVDVPVDGSLTWLTDPRAVSVDVFLDKVNPPLTKVVDALRVNSYDYSGLDPGTVYYWRVSPTYPTWGQELGEPEVDCEVTGTVFSFTTAGSPP